MAGLGYFSECEIASVKYFSVIFSVTYSSHYLD